MSSLYGMSSLKYGGSVGVNQQGTPMASINTPQIPGVLGAATSTAYQPAPVQNTVQNTNLPLEQLPSQPDNSGMDAAFQQGMQALDQYASTLQPMYDTAVNDYTNQAEQQKQQALGEQTTRLNALGQNKQEATTKGESAIAEARRQAAQLQQGIQSRYGGTTGTGAFTSEILGSQATQNIAGNRQAMEATLGKIAQAEEGVRSTTSSLLQKIDEDLVTQKENALNELRQSLAQIASKKGELASNQANNRMQALQNYQSLLSDINARNTAFKQQIYAKAQEAQQKIDSFKQSQLPVFNPELQATNFNVGLTPYSAVDTGNGKYTFLKGTTSKDNLDENGIPTGESLFTQ